MSTTADIRNGAVINFKNARMKIVEFQHVKPGKGPAFVRTKLKDIQSGKIIDHTFNSGAKIEFIRVTSRKFQYLYNDSTTYHFMNTDDYNQISIEEKFLDNPQLMKEGEVVTVITNSETSLPLSVEMPPSVILEVVSTEPGVKGNTATNATKPATLETGAIVNVPLFINQGDKIKIDTVKGNYKERYKE